MKAFACDEFGRLMVMNARDQYLISCTTVDSFLARRFEIIVASKRVYLLPLRLRLQTVEHEI